MLDMMSFAATLLPAAALTFPDVSPALVSIDLGFLGLGTFHLRWYALGYMAGIALAWWYASAMIRRPRLFGGTSPLTKDQLDDIMFWIIVGIILGGRFGYVLFYMVPYQFDVIAANPLTIFKIWDGGMAFHGGILGVTIALILFARRRKVSLLSIGDIAGVVAPIGIGLVRLANFVNAELYGRHTDAPIGMVFPEGYVRGSTPPASPTRCSPRTSRACAPRPDSAPGTSSTTPPRRSRRPCASSPRPTPTWPGSWTWARRGRAAS